MTEQQKLQPSEEAILEIADNMRCGYISYFNLQTGAITFIPENLDGYDLGEDNPWKEIETEIKQSPSSFLSFAPLPKDIASQTKEEFIEKMEAGKLKEMLEHAMRNPNADKNFKVLLDNSEFRDAWAYFEDQKCQTLIKAVVEEFLSI